jgi:hypothetical protein
LRRRAFRNRVRTLERLADQTSRSCLPVRSSRLPNDLPGHPKSGRPGVKKHADRLDSCLLANHKICQTLCTPRPGDQSLCLLTRNSGQTIPLPYRLAQTIPFGPINWPTIGFAPWPTGRVVDQNLIDPTSSVGPKLAGNPWPTSAFARNPGRLDTLCWLARNALEYRTCFWPTQPFVS